MAARCGNGAWLPILLLIPIFRLDRLAEGHTMLEAVSAAPTRGSRLPLAIVAAVLGAVLAGTAFLWAHYGTAVFYEMIVAGLAACL